jgi:hypothetical protein
MDSNSIYDQHNDSPNVKKTNKVWSKSSKSRFITKDTNAHLMQHFHFDP